MNETSWEAGISHRALQQPVRSWTMIKPMSYPANLCPEYRERWSWTWSSSSFESWILTNTELVSGITSSKTCHILKSPWTGFCLLQPFFKILVSAFTKWRSAELAGMNWKVTKNPSHVYSESIYNSKIDSSSPFFLVHRSQRSEAYSGPTRTSSLKAIRSFWAPGLHTTTVF